MPITFIKYLSSTERLTQRPGQHLRLGIWNSLTPLSLARGRHAPSSTTQKDKWLWSVAYASKDQEEQWTPMTGIQ